MWRGKSIIVRKQFLPDRFTTLFPSPHNAHQASPQRYAGDIEIHRILASVAKGKQAQSGVVSIDSKSEMRLAAVDRFPGGVAASCPVRLEFRHDSWFRDDVFASLHEARVALCLAESEKLETPGVHTADFSYIACGSRNTQPRFGRHSKEVLNLAQKREVLVYFKHEETPEGALRAE